MTLVVPALANAADQETSSEALRGWRERHQRLLRENFSRRQVGQETSTLLNETADGLDEDGGLDVVDQLPARQFDERRARALRSAFSRLERARQRNARRFLLSALRAWRSGKERLSRLTMTSSRSNCVRLAKDLK